jgi:hypothetical protein
MQAQSNNTAAFSQQIDERTTATFSKQGISIQKHEDQLMLTKEEFLKVFQCGIQTGYIKTPIGSIASVPLVGSIIDVAI